MIKKKTTKCLCCNKEIQGETCKLAAYSTTINGKTITFCCQTCAKEYKQGKNKIK